MTDNFIGIEICPLLLPQDDYTFIYFRTVKSFLSKSINH